MTSGEALTHGRLGLRPGGGFNGLTLRPENATPEANKLFQHPGVRERFSAAADTYREFIIKGGTLFAQRNGRVPVTVGEMEDFIDPAYQLARALDEAARSGATTSRSG